MIPAGRTGRRATFVLAISILSALAFVLAAKEHKLSPEEIIHRWKDGPVRYIMKGEEEEALLKLKTVSELAQFITAFWARRDPTPRTFQNEYRVMFWQRVGEANRRFNGTLTPGWKTDRGKILIILGEPFDTEQNSKLRDGPGAGRPSERWTYRRRYSKIADPEFYVVFYQEAAGEWRLSNYSRYNSPYYDFHGNTLDIGSSGDFVNLAPEPVPPIEASILANIDLGAEMTAAPSTAEAIVATVSAQDFVSAFAATARFEYFRAKDGSTFVNIGGLIKASELYGAATTGVSHLQIYVSLEPVNGSGETRYATNEKSPDSFDLSRGPDPGGLVAVWTGAAMKAGRYKTVLAIEDSLTGRIGRATAEIEVPDLSGANLSLSTLVLASALADAKDRVGVTARSSGVFRKSEEFGLYYEVYGLSGPKGTAPFDASYQFYRETPDGVQPIGHAIPFRDRTGASQGWSFPLAKWPPGRYSVEVRVSTADGKSAATNAVFEVVE